MSLKGKILKLLMEHGVLNGMQVCRLLNGRGKNEYEWCFWTFQEKPKGSTTGCRNQIEKKCRYTYSHVLATLKAMKAPVQNTKMKFWDRGALGKDVFRFFYLDYELFEDEILRQTLIPYIQK